MGKQKFELRDGRPVLAKLAAVDFKGLAEAKAKGWTVVDLKEDWKRVFPFEAK